MKHFEFRASLLVNSTAYVRTYLYSIVTNSSSLLILGPPGLCIPEKSSLIPEDQPSAEPWPAPVRMGSEKFADKVRNYVTY